MKKYSLTKKACYTGYVVQAIVNTFLPLLFVRFSDEFRLSTIQISLLILVNFGVQLIIDLLSAGFVDKIGIRKCVLAAHVLACTGLVSLSFLPDIMPPFAGLCVSIVLYATGSGCIEVTISPLIEALPTKRKAAEMSLLHSFYCWGHVAVVLLSTLFFRLCGVASWRLLAVLWAAVPAIGFFLFLRAPILPLVADGNQTPLRKLFGSRVFWLLMVMMTCGGATEQVISQWASAFAESGLHVSKTMGDLLGPCLFAFFMAVGRVLYAPLERRIKLQKYMSFCAVCCVLCYLLTTLSPLLVLSLAGVALSGFSVAIMWPGTFSLAGKALPRGGTPLFSMLALAGDLGCASGPAAAGFFTRAAGSMDKGILCSIFFPILLFVLLIMYGKTKKRDFLV